MIVKIKAYKYEELDRYSKWNVLAWLDEFPLDYEDDEGNTHLEYFSDMDTKDVIEHCEANEYLFSKSGKPIHNLIIKE